MASQVLTAPCALARCFAGGEVRDKVNQLVALADRRAAAQIDAGACRTASADEVEQLGMPEIVEAERKLAMISQDRQLRVEYERGRRERRGQPMAGPARGSGFR